MVLKLKFLGLEMGLLNMYIKSTVGQNELKETKIDFGLMTSTGVF